MDARTVDVGILDNWLGCRLGVAWGSLRRWVGHLQPGGPAYDVRMYDASSTGQWRQCQSGDPVEDSNIRTTDCGLRVRSTTHRHTAQRHIELAVLLTEPPERMSKTRAGLLDLQSIPPASVRMSYPVSPATYQPSALSLSGHTAGLGHRAAHAQAYMHGWSSQLPSSADSRHTVLLVAFVALCPLPFRISTFDSFSRLSWDRSPRSQWKVSAYYVRHMQTPLPKRDAGKGRLGGGGQSDQAWPSRASSLPTQQSMSWQNLDY